MPNNESKPAANGNGSDDQDYKSIAFALLRQHFDRVLPPLPGDVDLAALVEERLGERPVEDPYFRKLTYGLLRDQFERELPPLADDVDLEALIAQEGGLPFEAFIAEIERLEDEGGV